MEVKSWFEAVDRSKLEAFARKYHKVYMTEKGLSIDIKSDVMIVSCSNPHTDREWDEMYGQFGLIKNRVGILADLNNVEQEFFKIMYDANVGNTINGQHYNEQWVNAHHESLKENLEIQTRKINDEIDKLQTQKQGLTNKYVTESKAMSSFAKEYVEGKRQEKSLIVKDMLKNMTEEERTELLIELGYISQKQNKKSSKQEETIVINNGLNDIVLN